MHRCLTRLLLAGSLLVPAAAHAQAGPADSAATLPLERRVWLASKLHALVEANFAHWRAAPVADFDSLTRAYLAEAVRSDDRRAFDLATLAYVAALGNGHTTFNDRWLRERHGQGTGFYARHVEGRWVVTRSELPALRAGDVLAAIDGEPLEAFYQRQRRYVNGSDDRARRRVFFSRAFLLPPRFTLTLGDGRRVPVERRAYGGAAPAVETRALEDGRVAYLRIPSFGEPRFEDSALAVVARTRAAGTPALVIDLRGNNGGNTPTRLIRALMDRPWRSWAESTPLRVALFDFYRRHGMEGFADLRDPHLSWAATMTPPDSAAYAGRVVLLTDVGCVSACEDFAMPFRDNGRGPLVGATTQGSTGQPYYVDLGDGMAAGIGTKRAYFPDGREFEGVGIAPDVEVATTIEDLRRGRDPVLARALAILRGR